MLRFSGFSRIVVLGFVTGWMAGCGGGQGSSELTSGEAIESVALNQLAEAYRMYTIAKKAPPQKVADLAAIENLSGNGVSAARAGDLVVNWGATLPDTNEEPGKTPSSEILAYWKDVPEKGGWVLMLDRTVRQMTADQFKSVAKAPAPAATATDSKT